MEITTRITAHGAVTGTNALLVAAAAEVLDAMPQPRPEADPAFTLVLSRLSQRRHTLDDLAAAVRLDYFTPALAS
jgi:hypothetical protein